MSLWFQRHGGPMSAAKVTTPTDAHREIAIELVHRNVQCSWPRKLDERAADICTCSTHANARNEIARAIAYAEERGRVAGIREAMEHLGPDQRIITATMTVRRALSDLLPPASSSEGGR